MIKKIHISRFLTFGYLNVIIVYYLVVYVLISNIEYIVVSNTQSGCTTRTSLLHFEPTVVSYYVYRDLLYV